MDPGASLNSPVVRSVRPGVVVTFRILSDSPSATLRDGLYSLLSVAHGATFGVSAFGNDPSRTPFGRIDLVIQSVRFAHTSY